MGRIIPITGTRRSGIPVSQPARQFVSVSTLSYGDPVTGLTEVDMSARSLGPGTWTT